MTEYTDSDGVRYIAEPPRQGDPVCTGCAHARGGAACDASPTCVSLLRDDGHNIIWVRRGEGSFAD